MDFASSEVTGNEFGAMPVVRPITKSRPQSRRLNIPLTTVRQNMVTFTFYSHSKGTAVPVQAMNAYGKVDVQLHLFLTSELNGSWTATRSGGARWAPQLVSTFTPAGN